MTKGLAASNREGASDNSNMFVSKHGGQSEIILRVKQGDNPSFGFLMPDHHLHSYFRFLVEHPVLLQSKHSGKSQGEVKDVYVEHHNTNGIGEALSLFGSAYGSGEKEDGDCNANAEHELSQDNSNSINNFVSHGSKKMEFIADVAKDVLVSRNTTPSIKEKVLSVKKHSSISASKSGNMKGTKKDGKSGSFSATAEKTRSFTLGIPSKTDPIILEPPPELKGLIEKIVEFITRNGKQSEATLIEQGIRHGRFPFLLPSNQYNSHYLKVLQTAQEVFSLVQSSFRMNIIKYYIFRGPFLLAVCSKHRVIHLNSSFFPDEKANWCCIIALLSGTFVNDIPD